MSSDIVPFDDREPAASAIMPANPWDVGARVQSTFSIDDPAQLATIARGIQQADQKLLMAEGQEIEVTGFTYYLRRISKSDEAERDGLYIVVHGANGKTYETTSIGVRASIPLLIAQWGANWRDRPRKTIVAKKGRLLLLLNAEPVADRQPPKQNKKQG